MRLLKLHGSLGWWWVPNDESGATIVREEITNTFGHDPKAWTARKAHWTLGGREPFIVPPLAAKSPYYRNPLTRHLWRTAFEAIREADRIVFIGYSLPRTDLVVGGMVESAIRGREVDVLIVDPCPDGIAERLACLGGPAEESGRLTRFPGDNAVEEFARWLCEDTAKDVPPRAARLADELVPERRDPAIVVWSVGGEPRRHRVVAAENCSDGTLRLSTELEVFHGAEPSEQVPTTLDILGLARGARRIVARTAEGQESVIVACTVYGLGNPSARQMLYLVPAA